MYRGSIPSLPVPLSTLRDVPCGLSRMTRGQDGLLFLSCTTLSFAALCRFIPAHQARPCPTLGRPVHLRGGAPRLRPGTSPHALRIPPHGGHPALRELQSGGFRSALAVSDFRLRARLGVSIPFHPPRPARSYPRLWIRRSSFKHRRDLNPPESRAAQRTVGFIDTPGFVGRLEMTAQPLFEFRSVALNPSPDRGVVGPQAAFI